MTAELPRLSRRRPAGQVRAALIAAGLEFARAGGPEAVVLVRPPAGSASCRMPPTATSPIVTPCWLMSVSPPWTGSPGGCRSRSRRCPSTPMRSRRPSSGLARWVLPTWTLRPGNRPLRDGLRGAQAYGVRCRRQYRRRARTHAIPASQKRTRQVRHGRGPASRATARCGIPRLVERPRHGCPDHARDTAGNARAVRPALH